MLLNPQDPSQAPDYTRLSKTAVSPGVDQSGEILAKTLGGALETGFTVSDESIKLGLRDKVHETVDPIKDAWTTGLEQTKASLDQGIIPPAVQTPTGPSTGKSLLDANAMVDEDDIPPGLESGLDRVNTLAAAKAAGSPKLNDTAYARDILVEAKKLRSQYGPGYRDLVDSEISKASGLPVANSYAQNLLQDINRQLSQMGKAKDDPYNTALKNLDVPGMTDPTGQGKGYIDLYKAGLMTGSQLMGKIGAYQEHKSKLQINALEAAETDRADANKVKEVSANLDKDLTNEVALRTSAIIDTGTGNSYQKFVQYFKDASDHPEFQTQAQVDQKKMMFNAYVAQLDTKMKQIAATRSTLVGEKAAADAVKKAMAPVYAQRDFVNDAANGPAHYIAGQVVAIKEDAKYGFLTNKDTSVETAQLFGARDALGDQYFPTFVSKFVQNEFDMKYKGMFSQANMQAIQPYMDNRGQPIPTFMKKEVQKAKEVGAPPEYTGGVFGIPGYIADPKMPLAAKDKMIDWVYNGNNTGILEELKKDYRDPRTGAWVPGQYHGFNLLSAPKITDAVVHADKDKPGTFTKYTNHLESEFGNAFREDLLTLNKVVAPEKVPVDASGMPMRGTVSTDVPLTNKVMSNVHFSFNDKDNSFGIVDKNNRPITQGNLSLKDPNYSTNKGILDRLELVNSALRNLSYVHSKDPNGSSDTPTYLLKILQSAKFRPGENLTGATEGMAKALIKTKAPELTPQQIDEQILKFADDSKKQGPSVAQFVSNPTGAPLPKRVPGNVVGPNETIVGTKSDEIPSGMTVGDFIKELKRTGRY